MNNYEKIRDILNTELIPALGCTEPMAYGLCAAAARRYAKGTLQRIAIFATASMIKGVQYVKIPRTGGLCGGKLSCALGALAGNPDYGMEVFQDVGPADVEAAVRLVDAGLVTLERTDAAHRLYVKVVVTASEGSGTAIIQVRHNNIVYLESDGQILKDTRENNPSENQEPGASRPDYKVLSLESIYAFCKTAKTEDLAQAEKSIELTKALSEDGMSHPYGMCVGRTLREYADGSVITDDIGMTAVISACAGVDARMGGSPLPAMSNSGSGNQGITSSMPVIAVGERMGKSHEDILRAVAFSNLITIFVKTHYDPDYARMSAVCCASVAAGGAVCGIAFLRGDDVACIARILQTVLGNVCGLFCDGAKANCAAKIAMALHSAMQSMILAEAGIGADVYCGLVDETLEDTIFNFFRIQKEGMGNLEDVLCDIEAGKSCGLK